MEARQNNRGVRSIELGFSIRFLQQKTPLHNFSMFSLQVFNHFGLNHLWFRSWFVFISPTDAAPQFL